MKKLKHYEQFLNEKWILGVNESIFDKIESLVKGKSEKGKIVEEFLTKNSIQPKGSVYMIHFLGGTDAGKNELSHPFDYLHYTPGVAKLEDGVLKLVDENAKKLQTPDTLSFLDVMEKDDIAKNWAFGLKQGCSVNKGDYQFDISKEIPTLTIKKSMWSMKDQKWNPLEEGQEIQLDEDVSEFKEEDVISFKTPMAMITLEQWVEKLNATGWVKEDTEYFQKYIK